VSKPPNYYDIAKLKVLFEIANYSQKLIKIQEKLLDFYAWFKQVAKNIDGSFLKIYFHV
jgi:hypothetical protein